MAVTTKTLFNQLFCISSNIITKQYSNQNNKTMPTMIPIYFMTRNP